MAVWRLFTLLALAMPAVLLAQPRRPEAFGHVGFLRIAGDESGGPTTAQFGAGLMLPFTKRFAADVDLTTAKASEAYGSTDSYETRRTFFSGSVVARWGNERTYFFLGGGLGLENDRTVNRASNFRPEFRPPNGIEVSPGVFEFRNRYTDPTLVFRTGVVHTIRNRLLTRVDLLWSHRFVLPSIGLRVGVGYRF